jgi:hypothetical protein
MHRCLRTRVLSPVTQSFRARPNVYLFPASFRTVMSNVLTMLL